MSLRAHSDWGVVGTGLMLWLALSATATPGVEAHGSGASAEALHGLEGGSWVLHTNFGVITSEVPSRYVCEEAFQGGDTFRIAALGTRRWTVFTADAIWRTEDGCSFERVGALPTFPVDAAVRRDSDAVAYLLAAETAEESGVYLSRDGGASFERLDWSVGDRRLTRVGFLDADTLLVSSYTQGGQAQGAAGLTVLSLGGEAPRELEVPDDLGFAYLLDVEGRTFAWQATGDEGVILLRGDVEDPAQTRTDLGSWPNGAAFGPDGEDLWLAGAGFDARGLSRITPDGSIVDIAPAHSAVCVGRAGAELYVCASDRSEGHDLSRVVEGGVEPALSFGDLEGPRDCPAGSQVAETCPAVWPELVEELDPEEPVEGATDLGAGTPDAGAAPADMPEAMPDRPDDGGSCAGVRSARPAGAPGSIVAGVLVALGLLRRGRR